MKRLLVPFCLALAAAGLAAEPAGTIRRFALVAGANDGGYDRVRLRYAASDARAFAAVIGDLGGVKSEDSILLINPDIGVFEDALRRIRSRIQAAAGGERHELIVYYSGHADDEGLLLGRERFPYSRLRREVSEIEAEVRIAVVDSCSSGSLTRAKGGSPRPAFLQDSSTEMKGYAFLTSSSADEVAQESDRIGGSYFTHFLVGGLRGAADANGDGVVTLNEAYAYAFTETLASTERTQYGPQHPAYDIALTGKGDLVLTDVREAAARLVIGPDVAGRVFVRDRGGALVAEVAKKPGDALQLALEPGTYTVRVQEQDRWAEGSVTVSRDARRGTPLDRADLRTIAGEPTVGRGEDGEPGRRPADDYEKQTFHFSFLPEISSQGIYGSREEQAISINLLAGNAAAVNGVVLAGVASFVGDRVDGAQASGVVNVVGQDAWGAQLAGVVNWVGRDAGFYQGAGVLNLARGSLLGVQNSGVMNFAFGGVQGLQLAGVGNVSGEHASGAQAAGVFNYARSVTGAQLAGAVNVAGPLRGVQAGVVNIASDVTGAQVGLVNISRHLDGVPIGLINYERDGSRHLEVAWQGDRMTGAIRLGAGYVYSLLRGAVVPDSDPLEWSYGFGLGVEVPLFEPVFIDVDASLSQWLGGPGSPSINDPASVKPDLRVAARILRRPGFAFLAGASFELAIPGWHDTSDLKITPTAFVGMQFGRERSR